MWRCCCYIAAAPRLDFSACVTRLLNFLDAVSPFQNIKCGGQEKQKPKVLLFIFDKEI